MKDDTVGEENTAAGGKNEMAHNPPSVFFTFPFSLARWW